MVALPATPQWKSLFVHCLILLGLTAAIYFPAYEHGFVNFDDPEYTYQEAMVTKGLSWAGVYWSFSDYHYFNYHPLTWLSYMLDVELFGVSASAFHSVNLVLHFLCSITFYGFLLSLGASRYQALIGAAIFVAHPAQVESVAWISERKNLLSNLFGFLALISYLRFGRNRSVRAYILSLLLFLLALLSKPMVVTLPCLLLLLDFWPLNRVSVSGLKSCFQSLKGVLLEKVPFFVLTILFCKWTVEAQKGAIRGESLPLSEKLTQASANFGHYLKLYLYPLNLNVLHQSSELSALGFFAGASLLIVLGVTVWLFRKRASRGPEFIGWFWFLGTLVPVIGLIQVGAQTFAERSMYWSCPGLIILTAFMLPKGRSKKRLQNLAVLVVFLIFAALSFQRNLDWENSERLNK